MLWDKSTVRAGKGLFGALSPCQDAAAGSLCILFAPGCSLQLLVSPPPSTALSKISHHLEAKNKIPCAPDPLPNCYIGLQGHIYVRLLKPTQSAQTEHRSMFAFKKPSVVHERIQPRAGNTIGQEARWRQWLHLEWRKLFFRGEPRRTLNL